MSNDRREYRIVNTDIVDELLKKSDDLAIVGSPFNVGDYKAYQAVGQADHFVQIIPADHGYFVRRAVEDTGEGSTVFSKVIAWALTRGGAIVPAIFNRETGKIANGEKLAGFQEVVYDPVLHEKFNRKKRY